ncbi:hypothetical protein [Larkinella humicola]|uniref:Lipoprotein n=1 Tax=Larkinella humicola TaxID=2607654 RepID=A0A5N1JG45_9BACT|nr:hypothetical protein [Larkinella humicola]KAA9352718.1 hypothetical protein F0P93_16135 [Larkinella humicola]
MKKASTSVLLLLIFALLAGCKKEEETVSEFEQENAAYTAQFSFKTKSQQIAQGSDGKPVAKVVIEGTGSFSFAGTVTFVDEFDFGVTTGAATHKVTHTATNGDKIYATMTTQVGSSSITGTTTFTGGTGRFAKIKGSGPNTGPLLSATGEGTWKEEGGKVTF